MGEMREMREMLLLGLHCKVFDRLGTKTLDLLGQKMAGNPCLVYHLHSCSKPYIIKTQTKGNS